MSDYRVIIKVQNGRIWELIRGQGYQTVSAFCKAHGLSDTLVGKLLNMRLSPTTKTGEFRAPVILLAEALNALPEDLFTQRQHEGVDSNVRDFLVDERYMAQMLDNSGDPGRHLALVEMARGIQDRAKLSAREQKVIDLRYHQDLSLEETAKAMDLSRQRIQQIEAEAMRRMRSPAAKADVIAQDITG